MSTKSSKSSTVYQSGEKVPTTGTYEVAGAEPKVTTDKDKSAVRVLHEGELFPDYEGRAVSWHLQQTQTKPPALQQ
jgi:hypothetical protein